MKILQTERLVLRSWSSRDVESFRPIARDEEVMRYIGDGKPWPDDKVISFVNRQRDFQRDIGFSLWTLRLKEDNNFIGFCGLQPLAGTDKIEIGWWLARSCWGNGFATEAGRAVMEQGFSKHGLSDIVAIVQQGNAASLQVCLKLGMKFEREFPSNSERDVLLYSRSSAEHYLRSGV